MPEEITPGTECCKNCVSYLQPPEIPKQDGDIEVPPEIGRCRHDPPTLITSQVQRKVPVGMGMDGKPTFQVQTGLSYSSSYPPTPATEWCRQFELSIVTPVSQSNGSLMA